MGQRGGAAEQGEHQAGEVEPAGEGAAGESLEVAARPQEFGRRPLQGSEGDVGALAIGPRVFLLQVTIVESSRAAR